MQIQKIKVILYYIQKNIFQDCFQYKIVHKKKSDTDKHVYL